MKTKTTSIEAIPNHGADTITAVVGIDLGDKHSAYCVLDRVGAAVGDGVVKTSTEAFKTFLRNWQNESRFGMWHPFPLGQPSSPGTWPRSDRGEPTPASIDFLKRPQER